MDPSQNQPAQYPPGTYPVYPAYPGYPMVAPSTSGMAIASLIMAVLGWIAVPVLGQVLSIVFGHMALREIARSNGALRGEGFAKAGLIASYVTLGLGLLVGFVALVAVLIHLIH
jgi:hypothetical protein